MVLQLDSHEELKMNVGLKRATVNIMHTRAI